MSDIAKWLEENGLGEHAGLFTENDIDTDLLADLTDDDLKELGLSLGHLKRLRNRPDGQLAVATELAEILAR